eukprot:3249183-Prymnesium_polylepis.2
MVRGDADAAPLPSGAGTKRPRSEPEPSEPPAASRAPATAAAAGGGTQAVHSDGVEPSPCELCQLKVALPASLARAAASSSLDRWIQHREEYWDKYCEDPTPLAVLVEQEMLLDTRATQLKETFRWAREPPRRISTSPFDLAMAELVHAACDNPACANVIAMAAKDEHTRILHRMISDDLAPHNAPPSQAALAQYRQLALALDSFNRFAEEQFGGVETTPSPF